MIKSLAMTVWRWVDNSAVEHSSEGVEVDKRIDWAKSVPLLLLHASVLLILVVGWSWTAVGFSIGLYLLRMFSLTAFYHRYFAHRSFKTSRAAQLLFAVAGNTCAQRGPLWWASIHRHHHKISDQPEDPHSPKQHGFFWSHMGWFMSRSSFPTRTNDIRDFRKFPELRFLDRFDTLVPLMLGVLVYGLGEALAAWAPALGTNGPQLFVWGIISTVALIHGTSTINSLAHVFGRRRYKTTDTSRNSMLLTFITLGEGWHNNHHHFQSSTRLGHRWWEIDPAWYGLLILSWLGIIWDLKPVPQRFLSAGADGA